MNRNCIFCMVPVKNHTEKGFVKSEGESGDRTHITALTEQKMDCCLYRT